MANDDGVEHQFSSMNVDQTDERVVDDDGSREEAQGRDKQNAQVQQILSILHDDMDSPIDHEVNVLLRNVEGSLTEITADAKPRKRARLEQDWSPAPTPTPDASIVREESNCASLAENKASEIAASLVTLAKAALSKDGNVKKMQSILERMHREYTSLANRYTGLTTKLSREQENCTFLKEGIEKIHNDILELKKENDRLKASFGTLDSQIRCQICFENNRNTVLMPCLHFLFCKRCIEVHFQTSESRVCPICRNGVSGVLELQLEY